MHSSAFGAAARMVLRSFSSAARLSSLKAARYSSMVLGLPAMAAAPWEINDWLSADVAPVLTSAARHYWVAWLNLALIRPEPHFTHYWLLALYTPRTSSIQAAIKKSAGTT